jgi:hypothetical protein
MYVCGLSVSEFEKGYVDRDDEVTLATRFLSKSEQEGKQETRDACVCFDSFYSGGGVETEMAAGACPL